MASAAPTPPGRPDAARTGDGDAGLQRLWNGLRQFAWPSEFRIRPERFAAEFATDAVVDAAGPAGPDDKLFVELGNVLHSARSNLKQMAASGIKGKAFSRLENRLKHLERTLAEYDVQVSDLAGTPYDPRSLDFEPLGPKEPRPGVERDTILECTKALVVRAGVVLQAAVGFVVCPEDGESSAAETGDQR